MSLFSNTLIKQVINFNKKNIMKKVNYLKKSVLALVMLCASTSLCAQRLNAYKFIHVEETGNLYGVEDKLRNYFASKGFELIPSYDYEDMSSEDKARLLIATYKWNIVYGGHSTLILTLADVTGKIIYKCSGDGMAMTAKGDMRSALRKIFPQLDALNYQYDPNLIKINTQTADLPFTKWSEDSIRVYLRNNNTSSIEGIYKNYSNNLDYYQIAIIKHKETFYGMILDTENKRWEQGEIKMILNHIESNAYDVAYHDFKGKKLNAIATYENRYLKFELIDSNGQKVSMGFLKVYPSNNQTENESNNNYGDLHLKGTGSGVIISGNVVATNYHVINDAEQIKVVLNVDGMPEEYRARVLSTDKVNDLALLCIKDEHFTELPPAPFSLSANSSDVGTSVFTMGYPMSTVLGKEVKITDGLISSRTGFNGDAVTYQISAAIQPGNSGGALFDKNGHLVGITNAGIPSAENIGYAIKTSYLLSLIDSAPINIALPKGNYHESQDLPTIIKAYTPYVALIKVY